MPLALGGVLTALQAFATVTDPVRAHRTHGAHTRNAALTVAASTVSAEHRWPLSSWAPRPRPVACGRGWSGAPAFSSTSLPDARACRLSPCLVPESAQRC